MTGGFFPGSRYEQYDCPVSLFITISVNKYIFFFNYESNIEVCFAFNIKQISVNQDCVGAIDGTLVDAWVPASRQNTFRGQKATVSQNVLAAFDIDMLFTFINSGWEGSAHDNAILVDSITRADLQFPHPPNGDCP